MAKQFSRRLLLVILILCLFANIVLGYFFFKLTDSNTYSAFGNEQLYEDFATIIFDEVSSDISSNVEAQVAAENGIDLDNEFSEDIIEIVKDSILESNLPSITANAVPKNIKNLLSHIKGQDDEIKFFIPKDELIIFLEDYYPQIASKVIKLAAESDICDENGNCLSQEEKNEVISFIEIDLDDQIKNTLEEIKSNDPIFNGGNEITLEELNVILNQGDSESNLDEIRDALSVTQKIYAVGVIILIAFAIFNVLLFMVIMALGPLTPLRFSRNLGLVSLVTGILIFIPFGSLGLGINNISLDGLTDQSGDFERRLGEYIVDIMKSLFELLGVIGLVLGIFGAILLFVVSEVLLKRMPKAVTEAN